MSTDKKQKIQEPPRTDGRVKLVWRLYCARISAIDPIRDTRGVEKICRDELAIARTALKVFEDASAKGGV